MTNRCHYKMPFKSDALTIAWLTIAGLGLSISALPIRGQEAKEKADPVPKHKSDYSRVYYHSFKGDREIGPDFHWHGLEPQACVVFEPEGLRITLPTGHPGKRMGTGIGLNTTVKGDFEITMRFEILEEPKASGGGDESALFLWVDLNRPGMNRGFVGRVIRDGKQFVTWYHLAPDPPAKAVDVLRRFPAKESSGQLRIVRTGSMLYYYVAEGAGQEFKLLQKHPFGAEDLQAIRWGGQTGGPKASLEARFTDIRIRADDLPDLPGAADQAAPTGQAANPAEKDRGSTRWIVLGVGAGFGVLLLAAVTIALIVRLRSAAVPQAQGEPQTAQASFACPECGKRLKLRPGLEGKKVKCPQCGQSVQTPSEAVEENPG